MIFFVKYVGFRICEKFQDLHMYSCLNFGKKKGFISSLSLGILRTSLLTHHISQNTIKCGQHIDKTLQFINELNPNNGTYSFTSIAIKVFILRVTFMMTEHEPFSSHKPIKKRETTS